jgi:hypothetical protein
MATNRRPRLSKLELRLLRLLREAVEGGLVCPTDTALRSELGLTSDALLVAALRALEVKGRIVVEQGPGQRRRRVVTLIETGKSTLAVTDEERARARRAVRGQQLGRAQRGLVEEVAQARPQEPAQDLRIRGCQWIEGEPSIDDACMCGAMTQPGSSYCPEHHARAWLARPSWSAAL